VRAQGPPTAYPLGLQPIASDDFNARQGRRISRTDLDFEQALRAEGTVVLREGVDVNSLGVDASPANSKGWSSPATSTPVARSISRVALRPSTPVVVPPTPSPAPSSSTRLTVTNAVSSAVGSLLQPSSSPQAHDDDHEDSERQTNRRSLYRSPGTSSSPDLATLLRKAKERGGPAVSATGHHKRHESPPPPLPDAAAQQSSSSNSYLSSTLVASPLSKSTSGVENHSTERAISSARQPKENGTLKVCRFHIYVNWGAVCLIVYLATQAISESKDQCTLGKDDGTEHS
jgi:hypothetical protein